jgi:hypothetical protein
MGGRSWLLDQVKEPPLFKKKKEKEPPTDRISIKPCFEMKYENSLMAEVVATFIWEASNIEVSPNAPRNFSPTKNPY